MGRLTICAVVVAASLINIGSGSAKSFDIAISADGAPSSAGPAAPYSNASGGGKLFHNGGTGSCDGCHSALSQLLGSDPGSTCLRCHQAPPGFSEPYDYYVATDSSSLCAQLTPGGDFCWTRKNYSWYVLPGAGKPLTSPGARHGHNIVAADFGYREHPTLQVAPGGSYPGKSLSCTSCHDPHGNYRRLADGSIVASGAPVVASGSYANSPEPTLESAVGAYRLLAGKGYQPKTLQGVPAFSVDPPAAVSPAKYNRAETYTDTRVAYGEGMSEWCQNCHVQITSSNMHPTGDSAVLTAVIANNYNAYVSSGNLLGTRATSYSSLVPIEMKTHDYRQLKRTANSDGSERSGPSGAANVMCLTCHRAHASGWDNMLRWNMEGEFLLYQGKYPGIDNGTPSRHAQGRLAAETRKTFYDRPASLYAEFQRSLCNKCHVQD
jgi:hypothetical protein